MQKYHTSSAKYCLEHTKFPDDFLKIKSMLTGKWIIWSDLNHFWVKKKSEKQQHSKYPQTRLFKNPQHGEKVQSLNRSPSTWWLPVQSERHLVRESWPDLLPSSLPSSLVALADCLLCPVPPGISLLPGQRSLWPIPPTFRSHGKLEEGWTIGSLDSSTHW